MPSTIDYALAFKRNCPGLRMNNEEVQELARLFRVCWEEAVSTTKISLTEQANLEMKGTKK